MSETSTNGTTKVGGRVGIVGTGHRARVSTATTNAVACYGGSVVMTIIEATPFGDVPYRALQASPFQCPVRTQLACKLVASNVDVTPPNAPKVSSC